MQCLPTANIETQLFLNCIEDNFLVQHVKVPTRQNSILDLVISESQESVDEVKNIGQFAGSGDHSMLYWNICYENETRDEKSSSENFDYSKGNYEAMKQELDLIKWEELLQPLSIDESWKKVKEVICKLESNYIPLRRIPKKLSRKPVFDLFCIH